MMTTKKPFATLQGHLGAQHFALAKLISHLAEQGSVDLEKFLFSLSNNAIAYRNEEAELSASLDQLVEEVRNLHSQGKPEAK